MTAIRWVAVHRQCAARACGVGLADRSGWADPDSLGQHIFRRGSRRLWDEVEAAYRWWRDAGEPKAADWLFTVTPDNQRVELRAP